MSPNTTMPASSTSEAAADLCRPRLSSHLSTRIQDRREEQRDDERERDDVNLAEQQDHHIEACRYHEQSP